MQIKYENFANNHHQMQRKKDLTTVVLFKLFCCTPAYLFLPDEGSCCINLKQLLRVICLRFYLFAKLSLFITQNTYLLGFLLL